MASEGLKSQWPWVLLPALIVIMIVLVLLAPVGFLILARLGMVTLDLP